MIKEWGVKVALSNNLSGAYYEPGNQEATVFSQLDLSLQSPENTQCKADRWPPAIYFRYTSQDKDPVSGKLYTQLEGTQHKIGKYYYA